MNSSTTKSSGHERMRALPAATAEREHELIAEYMRGRSQRLEQCLEILDHQEQVVRIGRAGFELPSLVPPTSGVVLGMHQQTADARDVSGLRSAQQRIL